MSKISQCAALMLLVGLSANGHAQQNTPNDPEIAAIVLAANQVDVDAGKLAVMHGYAKDVRQFALSTHSSNLLYRAQATSIGEQHHTGA